MIEQKPALAARLLETRVVDAPYRQKHAAIVALPGGRHPNDVRGIAALGDTAWCATADGVYSVRQRFEPDAPVAELPPEWTPPAAVDRCDAGLPGADGRDVRVDRQGRLWVATLDGVAVRQGAGWSTLWSGASDAGYGAVVSILPDGEAFWAITSHAGLGRVADGRWRPVTLPDAIGRPLRLDTADAGIWVCGSAGAAVLDTDGAVLAAGSLGRPVRRAVSHQGTTYLATSDGIAVRAPGGVFCDLMMPMPASDLHDLRILPDGTLWAATSRGVWRRRPGEARVHFYASRRYVPHPDCRALAPAGDGTMWVATAAGLSHLAELPMTLDEKAARFEQRVRRRHLRLDGFVTSSRLHRPGDLRTSEPWPSDNDGLWTALYLAAESYRYAATGSPEARQFAGQAFSAMERLEAVTTVPGFPTKAIVPPGHPEAAAGGVPWYPSADSAWLWKGDCSSDEIDGHLYGYAIFYDLAASADERPRVEALVDRIMGHILDHGFLVVGPDGRHTRWGVWAPEHLNGDQWKAERGLNSLEILAHLRTAHHITGQPRYLDAYYMLIEKHHYAENARRQKIDLPGHVNHSDDELAFISYYPLLRYEDDPALRAIYLESLEHAWQIERPERNPLWNLIYTVLTGRPGDVAAGVQTLREIPLDLIDWHVDNNLRQDVTTDAHSGRFGELQLTEVLPYDELPVSKWNGNPYGAQAGSGGHSEDDGTHLLLPYWMGRYYGLIDLQSRSMK